MKTIYFKIILLLSSLSFAQWSDDYSVNTQITTTETLGPRSFITAEGKTYVLFWDQSDQLKYKYQILDSDGNKLLDPNGKIMNATALMGTSTLTNDQDLDSDGNLYVSFTATGNVQSQGHRLNGYVHKISPEGMQLWGDSGIFLGQLAYDTKVKHTLDGGAYIGWLNQATGRAQLNRVSPNGELVWTSPMIINSPTNSVYTSVGELAALSDGSVIVFFHVRSSMTTIYSTLWAQRFNPDGTAVWSAPVQVSSITTTSNKRYSLVQDGDTVYLGLFANAYGKFNSYLQRVNPDGTLPWGVDGADFGLYDFVYEMETNIAYQQDSPYIWSIVRTANDLQGEFGISIQKFDKTTGERLLSDNAKELFPLSEEKFVNQGNLQLIDDQPLFIGTNGITTGSTPLNIFISQLDENGDFIWDEKYKVIASTNTSKTSINLSNSTFAVASWLENRDGSGSRAYVQNYIPETNQAPVNDNCDGALPLTCGDSQTGNTVGATDSGANEAADVFYKFTGNGEEQLVTISLCGSGYDTALRVFSGCDLTNQIAFNDDSDECVDGNGLQSQLTFTSDGTSEYIIMVEGYDDNTGDFSISLTCEVITDPTEYCQPLLNCNDGDLITNVTFAEINNDTDCSPEGYGNYIDQLANVEAGSTNPISVTVGAGFEAESVSVWIDYNNNFVFEEDEFTYIGTGSGNDVVGNITIPEGTADGEYRMRVRVAAVGAALAIWNMACDEDQGYGETEDYTINVGELSANDYNNSNFKYYPNPVKDILNISYTANISNISIHDLSGKQLHTQSINNKQAQINISHFTSGVYVVKANVDGETKTFKIVKK